MQEALETLEWLTKYGFIDIFFGIGVIGIVLGLVRRIVPANYDQLHIDAVNGAAYAIPGADNVPNSLMFRLSNAGQTNIFITRCYFKAAIRPWFFLWLVPLSTRTKVHPLSRKITHKNAFELKFEGNSPGFSNYEAMIKPGNSSGISTFLALSEPVGQDVFNERNCGTIYVEYATSGKRGIHVLRV